jgi:hypothetical protein
MLSAFSSSRRVLPHPQEVLRKGKNLPIPRKCYRQVIDLMRPCLVFGVPFTSLRVTENMTLRSQHRRRRLICPVILALLCAAACSRPADVPTGGTLQDDAAPFRPDSHGDGDDSATPPIAPPEKGLPFRDSQTLPPGTLLTVRLKGAITTGTATSQNSFQAVVDEPVVVEGNTLIPRGTAVVGRIESSRISKVKPNQAYVRLALESVQMGGLEVPVQTASLFTRETPQSDESIRMEKGRRLTFRLMEPVVLNTQSANVGR